MSAEHFRNEPQTVDNPIALLELKKDILAAWEQLPPEHQVSVALMLLKEVQKGELELWFKEENALRWLEDVEDLPFLAMGPPEPVELTQLPPPLEMENPADFNEWMKQADGAVWRMAGCSIRDLVDRDYRSIFEDGVTPSEAADEALIEAGFNRFE